MKFVRNLGLAVGVAACVCVGTVAPAVALEPGEAIAARKAVMRSLGAHLAGIKGAVGAGNGKAVAIQAGAVAALAGALPQLFPKGSGPSAGKTRALDKIWAEWDKFAGVAKALQAEAAALAKVAGTNDAKQMGAQFGKMIKAGCGSCHGAYRAKKN